MYTLHCVLRGKFRGNETYKIDNIVDCMELCRGISDDRDMSKNKQRKLNKGNRDNNNRI